MRCRTERWVQVHGCKQVVLFHVRFLPGLPLLLCVVFTWSLCTSHSRDGVGCLQCKPNPSPSSCDPLKDEKESLAQLGYQTWAFPAPKLVSWMQHSRLCLRCLHSHSVLKKKSKQQQQKGKYGYTWICSTSLKWVYIQSSSIEKKKKKETFFLM